MNTKMTTQKGAKKLTRNDQKLIVGGYSAQAKCYVHSSDWSEQIECSGPSSCASQAAAQGHGFKWCCASCETSAANPS